MTLHAFADLIGAVIVTRRSPNRDGLTTASIEDADILVGEGMFRSATARGGNVAEAESALAREIASKRIRLHSFTPEQCVYTAPKDLRA